MTAYEPPSPSDAIPRPPLDWAAALVEHGRWLRTVVSSRLRERQAVDEVMQEISLAAVEQRSPLADASKLSAWLYRLAVLKVLLYRRQRGRQSKLFGRYATRVRDSGPDRPDGGPLGWLVDAERTAILREAIGRLPRRDAEILLLKYTEDWSYRELAEHLGQTEGAIQSRLHRARRRLRDELSRVRGLADGDP